MAGRRIGLGGRWSKIGFGRFGFLRWGGDGGMGIARIDADWEVSMNAFEEKANEYTEKSTTSKNVWKRPKNVET